MKKYFCVSLVILPLLVFNCLPQEKQTAFLSPQLISLLDSLGIHCEDDDLNLSPCDSSCLSIKWILSNTGDDSLLLITDKNCYGSGDMRSWICKVDGRNLYVVQSFAAVQSITEVTSQNSYPDLFVTQGISQNMSTQKENISLRYVFANGLYTPREITLMNATNFHIPVSWLELSGKNIDGCDFFMKHKTNKDTLQLKNFNKVKVSESLWVLNYIDDVRFVAHSWLIETNAQSDHLLIYLPGKIISQITDTTDKFPEFNLSFFSGGDSIECSGIHYRWTGAMYESTETDTNCYYFGKMQ